MLVQSCPDQKEFPFDPIAGSNRLFSDHLRTGAEHERSISDAHPKTSPWGEVSPDWVCLVFPLPPYLGLGHLRIGELCLVGRQQFMEILTIWTSGELEEWCWPYHNISSLWPVEAGEWEERLIRGHSSKTSSEHHLGVATHGSRGAIERELSVCLGCKEVLWQGTPLYKYLAQDCLMTLSRVVYWEALSIGPCFLWEACP